MLKLSNDVYKSYCKKDLKKSLETRNSEFGKPSKYDGHRNIKFRS